MCNLFRAVNSILAVPLHEVGAEQYGCLSAPTVFVWSVRGEPEEPKGPTLPGHPWPLGGDSVLCWIGRPDLHFGF